MVLRESTSQARSYDVRGPDHSLESVLEDCLARASIDLFGSDDDYDMPINNMVMNPLAMANQPMSPRPQPALSTLVPPHLPRNNIFNRLKDDDEDNGSSAEAQNKPPPPPPVPLPPPLLQRDDSVLSMASFTSQNDFDAHKEPLSKMAVSKSNVISNKNIRVVNKLKEERNIQQSESRSMSSSVSASLNTPNNQPYMTQFRAPAQAVRGDSTVIIILLLVVVP